MNTEVTRLRGALPVHSPSMTHLEQFEVLQLHGEKWELVAAFRDLDFANEVARNRRSNVRVVHSAYDDGKKTAEEILLDLGSTRELA